MINVNEYFNGNVKSLTCNNMDGKSTVGIIAAGEYEFSTSTAEIMKIVSGSLEALIPGNPEWMTFKNGDMFRVEKNSSFKVRASADCAYWCRYL